jgi:hypothetical protein
VETSSGKGALTACLTACLLLFTSFSPEHALSQDNPSPDYRQIFGSDYLYAENLLENNHWWADSLEAHGIEPGFALAIIFPELIRYSSLSDYLETRALEVLYVQYGRDYADFSIGYFQMKPSFAERIEADILEFDLIHHYPKLSLLVPDTTDHPDSRRERVLRLKDESGQLRYLEAFIRIMDLKYSGELKHVPGKMKLEFYATAYNTGYFKEIRTISASMKQNHFFRGIDNGSEKYNYAGIALYYYHNSAP